MGNTGLKQHLENSRKTGVFQLRDANLSEFPEELVQIATVLRTLDLSNNKISHIPASIGCFIVLKHLSLSKNHLGFLPTELGQLLKLETLLLNSNRLLKIPSSLSTLTHLKILNLSDNRLAQFPLEFCKMRHLDLLDLSKNKIMQVPDSVGDIQVCELNLNQNQVSVLSDELSRCLQLKTLRLEENCLTLASISPVILRDSKISLLAVEGNLFDVKDLTQTEGYSQYMERYTATKKKMY